MAASSNEAGHRPPVPPLGRTSRDDEVLRSHWEFRQLTREQVQRLHFGGAPGQPGALSPSIALRRLGLLHWHGYLVARRRPSVQRAGSAPYVYSLGPRSVPLIAWWF